MTPVERAPARPWGNRYVAGTAGDVRPPARSPVPRPSSGGRRAGARCAAPVPAPHLGVPPDDGPVRCGALVRLRHGPAPAPRPLTRAAAGRLWRDDLAHAVSRTDLRRRGPFPG
ncbi:hypothetical protein AB0O68_22155 [Streptomyces sp. NPDC087512]|uniref:hypothetical protein n=1 Tax=Streptomyces sp. NPDC087512 TaxID=3155059 RepID=UPI003427100E